MILTPKVNAPNDALSTVFSTVLWKYAHELAVESRPGAIVRNDLPDEAVCGPSKIVGPHHLSEALRSWRFPLSSVVIQGVSETREYSSGGVDLTMIRWMLSLTPEERPRTLENFIRFVWETASEDARKRLTRHYSNPRRPSCGLHRDRGSRRGSAWRAGQHF